MVSAASYTVGKHASCWPIRLFFVQDGKSKMWGEVYDQKHKAKTLTNYGWNDATGYIREKMAEDDRLQ
jgi:hypothetical protein